MVHALADLDADLAFESRRCATASRWSAGAERAIDELFEGQLLVNGWVTGGKQTAGQRDALSDGKLCTPPMRQRVPCAPHPSQPRSVARQWAHHSPTHRRQHPTALSGRRRPLQQSKQWPPRWWRRQRQRGSSAMQCGSHAATSTLLADGSLTHGVNGSVCVNIRAPSGVPSRKRALVV